MGRKGTIDPSATFPRGRQRHLVSRTSRHRSCEKPLLSQRRGSARLRVSQPPSLKLERFVRRVPRPGFRDAHSATSTCDRRLHPHTRPQCGRGFRPATRAILPKRPAPLFVCRVRKA
ncbi:unnamed protein product [Soboliphyme baturini]|uniref:Uncharacterized protein n=1 Tax=Soboliphyme baturini TaxID=241478 RepID=A0A183IK41_9BILA|nr:unnamed protein product [Soboliphyme baturini]